MVFVRCQLSVVRRAVAGAGWRALTASSPMRPMPFKLQQITNPQNTPCVKPAPRPSPKAASPLQKLPNTQRPNVKIPASQMLLTMASLQQGTAFPPILGLVSGQTSIGRFVCHWLCQCLNKVNRTCFRTGKASGTRQWKLDRIQVVIGNFRELLAFLGRSRENNSLGTHLYCTINSVFGPIPIRGKSPTISP